MQDLSNLNYIQTIDELEQNYAAPADASLKKVVHQLTPLYRKWIAASRFCVLGTVGPDGTDTSPRGDNGPVAIELDPHHLAIPDWRGNNRLDTLRNIVLDGRISVIFFVPGDEKAVRINGRARITTDATLLARFAKGDEFPKSVIIIQIGELYAQCARALMRSQTWGDIPPPDLPRMGEFIAEATQGEFDAVAYEAAWPDRAKSTLWSD